MTPIYFDFFMQPAEAPPNGINKECRFKALWYELQF